VTNGFIDGFNGSASLIKQIILWFYFYWWILFTVLKLNFTGCKLCSPYYESYTITHVI